MGLILDSGILIASERRRETPAVLLYRIRDLHGETDIGISTVTVVEITHGIYRAKTKADEDRRRDFVDNVLRGLTVYPVTTEIAQLAGQIDGVQTSLGNIIDFEDLVIGATALYLGYQVMTLNVRHFERIPGLRLAEAFL